MDVECAPSALTSRSSDSLNDSSIEDCMIPPTRAFAFAFTFTFTLGFALGTRLADARTPWLWSDECELEPWEIETSPRWHDAVVGVGSVDSAPDEDTVRVGESAGSVVARLPLPLLVELFVCASCGGCG